MLSNHHYNLSFFIYVTVCNTKEIMPLGYMYRTIWHFYSTQFSTSSNYRQKCSALWDKLYFWPALWPALMQPSFVTAEVPVLPLRPSLISTTYKYVLSLSVSINCKLDNAVTHKTLNWFLISVCWSLVWDREDSRKFRGRWVLHVLHLKETFIKICVLRGQEWPAFVPSTMKSVKRKPQ